VNQGWKVVIRTANFLYSFSVHSGRIEGSERGLLPVVVLILTGLHHEAFGSCPGPSVSAERWLPHVF
jgi:hypothetical protein